MGRLVFILRHKLPVIIFVIAAAIGGVLIFWYINNREENTGTGQEYAETQESISTDGEEVSQILGGDTSSKDHGQPVSSSIPNGLRAVNLPISFFGDVSAIREEDRVDIISVFYDPGSNDLYSEIILGQKEIIILEGNEDTLDPGKYQDASDSGYLSSGIFSDMSSGNNNCNQLKKILVITFYLEANEVEKAFKAIEGGQLYLSLCPADNEGYAY